LVSLDDLRKIFKAEQHYYTVHAQEQMALRHLRNLEVRDVILGKSAEIIEQYPEDKYSPSCLVYGVTFAKRILHVQVNSQGVVITVYEPDAKRWLEDKKTRRRS